LGALQPRGCVTPSADPEAAKQVGQGMIDVADGFCTRVQNEINKRDYDDFGTPDQNRDNAIAQVVSQGGAFKAFGKAINYAPSCKSLDAYTKNALNEGYGTKLPITDMEWFDYDRDHPLPQE